MTDLHERWTYYPRAGEARVEWWGTVLGWSWTHRGVGRGGFVSQSAAVDDAIVSLPEPEAKHYFALGEPAQYWRPGRPTPVHRRHRHHKALKSRA